MEMQFKASDVLSDTEQKGILALAALNKLENKRGIRKRFKIGRFVASFRWQSSKHLWGRFGGGWQWALGFEASRGTLLLNLLVCSLMIWREKTKQPPLTGKG